jgi:hypothetical protein
MNNFAKGSANAHTALAALHLELGDTGLRRQLD